MVIIQKRTLLWILAITILIILITIVDIPKKIQKIIYKKEYSTYVEKYAKEYNVDENLIYAVIKAESNFKVNAKSDRNAIGLMQLMETTAKDIMKKVDIQIADNELKDKLRDPEININLGTKYLSILLEKYQNIELALCAYNAGMGTVNNWIESGILNSDGSNIEKVPYKETNNYIRKILRDYKIYTIL